MARERTGDINTDAWWPYNQITDYIDRVVNLNNKNYVVAGLQKKNDVESLVRSVWGSEVKLSTYLSPSLAAYCLRTAGYAALGYTPSQKTTELELQSQFGSSIHYTLLRLLDIYQASFDEYPFKIETPGISGRIDFFLKNPVTNKWQILDLKCTSSFIFNKVKRTNLPSELRTNKHIYSALPEARRQLLIYMWSMSQREYKFDIACAQALYLDRNSAHKKLCLIPWEAGEKAEADQYMELFTAAWEKVKQGELPEPTVLSGENCVKLCRYLEYCEYGQRYAQGEKPFVPRRILSPQVKRLIDLDKKRRKDEMQRLGITPMALFGDEVFNEGLADIITQPSIMENTGGMALPRTGGNFYRAQLEKESFQSEKKEEKPSNQEEIKSSDKPQEISSNQKFSILDSKSYELKSMPDILTGPEKEKELSGKPINKSKLEVKQPPTKKEQHKVLYYGGERNIEGAIHTGIVCTNPIIVEETRLIKRFKSGNKEKVKISVKRRCDAYGFHGYFGKERTIIIDADQYIDNPNR